MATEAQKQPVKFFSLFCDTWAESCFGIACSSIYIQFSAKASIDLFHISISRSPAFVASIARRNKWGSSAGAGANDGIVGIGSSSCNYVSTTTA